MQDPLRTCLTSSASFPLFSHVRLREGQVRQSHEKEVQAMLLS